jgi:hypothetical protein
LFFIYLESPNPDSPRVILNQTIKFETNYTIPDDKVLCYVRSSFEKIETALEEAGLQ